MYINFELDIISKSCSIHLNYLVIAFIVEAYVISYWPSYDCSLTNLSTRLNSSHLDTLVGRRLNMWQNIAIMLNIMFVIIFIFENSIIIDEFNVKFYTKITCIIDALRVRAFNNFITSIRISSDRVKTLIVITIILNESIAKDYLDNLTKNVNVKRTRIIVKSSSSEVMGWLGFVLLKRFVKDNRTKINMISRML